MQDRVGSVGERASPVLLPQLSLNETSCVVQDIQRGVSAGG